MYTRAQGPRPKHTYISVKSRVRMLQLLCNTFIAIVTTPVGCIPQVFVTRLQEYHMEGNFGSGKIWRIHCMNILAEKNLAKCEILQVKISQKAYSVKHSERLRHATNL